MAKYLIQDIIPPERRSGHSQKIGVRVTHHKPLEEPHAKTTHRVVPHDAHDTKINKPENTEDEPEASEQIKSDPKMLVFGHIKESADTSDLTALNLKKSHDIFSTTDEVAPSKAPWLQSADQGVTGPVAPSRSRNFTMSSHTGNSSGNGMMMGWLPWILGTSTVVVSVILIMNYFAGATITVIPKKLTVPMEQKISTLKQPLNGELPFAIMKITLEETREVPATGEKTVTSKASGKIYVYNTQSTAQRLIKNTRFQNPTGKIYRINDSIIVPKATTKNGAVYARSKGPLSGGESGTIKSVSDLDLKQASEDLRVQLETKLRNKARGDLTPSQVGYDKGMVINLGTAALSQKDSSTPDKAVVAQTGTLYFVTFDRNELTRAIAHSLVPTYNGEGVHIENLDSLKFEMAPISGKELWSSQSLDVLLSGNPTLEWDVDANQIKQAVLGIPKGSFNSILIKFATIESAKATIHPVWKRSFPTNENDLNIEVVSEAIK
ncbi:MAG: hypothetical protein UY04_C0006G0007 [Parcubacteria group bacterium GW2011_GWA2_47_7]|nr:MAG: hypothetical protein UY04_C0006G0007 [Parcubacteria group bacterium GW2011_GWA2_47_7]